MNLKPRRNEEPSLDITSLIDVVLMLVVFFMLSSTFVQDANIEVQLPESSAPPITAQIDTTTLTIDAQGRYYVEGHLLANSSAQSLKQALAAAAQGDYNNPLTIRADARTTHQSVVTAMDVAGQLGFVHLNIVTTNSPDK